MQIAEQSQQAPQDGPGSIGVQLLVQDGLEQRFKGRVRAFHPQRKGTDTFDQRAQLGVRHGPIAGAPAQCRSEPGGGRRP
jgi:hypothetical protein